MLEFRFVAHIAAPLEHTWEILVDIERWPEWTSSITRVEPLTALPMTLGTRVKIYQPKLRPAVWQISDWQPKTSFTWLTKNPGLVVIGHHQLDPAGDGCTLTLTLRFEGLLGGFAGRLSRRISADYMQREANGLKAHAERRP